MVIFKFVVVCVSIYISLYDRVIDGVHMKINDSDGLQAVCEQGKQLGFDGKSLIHPSQVNAVMILYKISMLLIY